VLDEVVVLVGRSTSERAKVSRHAPSRHSNGGPGRGRATSCPSTTSPKWCSGSASTKSTASSRTRGVISVSSSDGSRVPES
jgi:hypothetical protein